MSKANFELNLPGLNQIMKGPEMQSILSEKGSQVMANANSMAQDPKAEYSMSVKTLNYIAVADVRAETPEAIHENLENNTLLKSLR